MKILAIDPGYERMGVAILEKVAGKEKLLFSECFKTSSKLQHSERLKLIGEEIEKLIKEFEPEALAIETLFFSNNQKTALQVSEARGVMLYVAEKFGLSVKEFKPVEIKIAVTGYGASDKNQIINMIPKLIKIEKEIHPLTQFSSKANKKNFGLKERKMSAGVKYDDEFDAIAVGLTFFATNKQLLSFPIK